MQTCKELIIIRLVAGLFQQSDTVLIQQECYKVDHTMCNFIATSAVPRGVNMGGGGTPPSEML